MGFLGYLIIFLSALILIAVIRGLYEPHCLEITHTTLGDGKNFLRILLLTDIHVPYFFVSVKKLKSIISSSDLDAIAFIGDLSNNKRNYYKGLKILNDLNKTAKKYSLPFFAVSGNHDPKTMGKDLEEIDIIFLDNSSYIFQKTTKRPQQMSGDISAKKDEDGYDEYIDWQIVGLADYRNSTPSYNDAVNNIINKESYLEFPRSHHLSSANSSCPTNKKEHPTEKVSPTNFKNKIILAHNPDCVYGVIDSVSKSKRGCEVSRFDEIDNINVVNEPDENIFMLSGHFHGGQIWMPFNIEYSILRHERMCKEGYRKGSYEKGGVKGYISRGLGCVLVPFRFFSKPEAAIIEMRFNPKSKRTVQTFR